MTLVHIYKATILGCACAVVAAGAPSVSAQDAVNPRINSTLTGCVSRERVNGHYILTQFDATNKDAAKSAIEAATEAAGVPGFTSGASSTSTSYELKNYDMTAYAGRRVEVTGVLTSPPPNPMAEAGAAIPGASAIPGAVATAGTIGGGTPIRQMSVLQVKPRTGSCP